MTSLEAAAPAAACMLGNHAIVRGALEAGLQFFSCYPGTPSSEIGDSLATIAAGHGIHFEYSVNEKVSVEIAFAASLTGARSMCAMKHLGLLYAGDPVSTIPYVGVEGGLVIVSAGDPSALTSPNEQDQRHLASFLFYPVLDPATPEDARRMTRFAFELSEETRLPVLLRPTTRVCHTSGMVHSDELPAERNPIEFKKDPSRYVPIPVNARRMRRELNERLAAAERLMADSDFFGRTGSGTDGIVASGVAFAYTAAVVEELGLGDRVSLLQIGGYPIPATVLDGFLGSVDRVLVVEELTPYVEERVMLAAFRGSHAVEVRGKLSGDFPQEFEYDPDMIEDAIRRFVGLEERPRPVVAIPELPPRPPVLCPGCSHRTSFYLTKRVFGKKTVHCNDIGCYTLGYGEPLDCCDVLLCMGSSISQASGIARTTGQRTLAYIGDSTFFHSGLPPLLNALEQDDPITVVILNNYVTAMTGFQPSPTTTEFCPTPDPTSSEDMGVRIERAVRGLGARRIWSLDPFDEEAALDALRQAKADEGTNVVIFNSPCDVAFRNSGGRDKRVPYEIDQEACNRCSLCVRVLGCPAILVEDGVYRIDATLCTGCDLCAEVCQRDAIAPEARDDAP